MKFHLSNHCQNGAHCRLCRSPKNGLKWRTSLLPHFDDLQTPDFPCPKSHPWRTDPPATPPLDFPTILATILSIPPLTDSARLLHSLTAQTLTILERPDLTPCARTHQEHKIAQYLLDYQTPPSA